MLYKLIVIAISLNLLNSCSISIGQLDLKKINDKFSISINSPNSHIESIRMFSSDKSHCNVDVRDLNINMFNVPFDSLILSRAISINNGCVYNAKNDYRISVLGRKGDIRGYGYVKILSIFNSEESNWLFNEKSVLFAGINFEYVNSTSHDWVELIDKSALINDIDSVIVMKEDGVVIGRKIQRSKVDSTSYGMICDFVVEDYENITIKLFGIVFNGHKSNQLMRFNVGNASGSLRMGGFK